MKPSIIIKEVKNGFMVFPYDILGSCTTDSDTMVFESIQALQQYITEYYQDKKWT